MRKDIRHLNELSDSREMLEAKPNPLMVLFIYLLLIMIVSALIWIYYGKMDEVVKADGVIRTVETPSKISNEEAGQVKVSELYEGKEVDKDDVLLEMDASEEQLQKKLLEEQIEKKETRIADLKLLKASIEKNKNQFSKKKKDSEMHQRYEAYQSSLRALKEDFESEKTTFDESKKQQQTEKENLGKQEKKKEAKISNLKKLKKAMDKDKNVFSKKEKPYYSRLKDIQLKVKQLKANVTDSKEALKSNPNNAEAAKAHEVAKKELEQYKAEQSALINNELEQLENDVQNIKLQTGANIDYDKINKNKDSSYKASKEQFKSDMLADVASEIDAAKDEIDEIQQNIAALDQKIEKLILKAPQHGTVHVNTELTEGDFIEPGTEIATILPDVDNQMLKVQLMVLNEDIAKTNEGDDINFRIDSLPYQEYGNLEGEITKIGSDATIDPETGMSYYLVDAKLKQHSLTGYNDEQKQVKVGMTVEGHIITDSKKIMYFLLEKLNLKDG